MASQLIIPNAIEPMPVYVFKRQELSCFSTALAGWLTVVVRRATLLKLTERQEKGLMSY